MSDTQTTHWMVPKNADPQGAQTELQGASTPSTDLAPPELADETALSFVNVTALSTALQAEGWNSSEEAKLLAEIARDRGEGGRVRLMAMDAIRKRVLDALRFSGRLVKQTMSASTTEADDTAKIEDVTRIVKSMQQTTFFTKGNPK